MPYGRSYGGIFSIKILSFQINLICVSSWHKTRQHKELEEASHIAALSKEQSNEWLYSVTFLLFI